MKQKDLNDVKHILSKLSKAPGDDLERRLMFFRANVELERYKAAHAEQYSDYPLNIENSDTLLIDLPCNEEFCKNFEDKVQKGTFHGVFAIALEIQNKGEKYKLLELCRSFDTVKTINIDRQLFACKISDFTVNMREAGLNNILSATIRGIERDISEVKSFAEAGDVLRKYLGQDAKISDEVYLTLKSEDFILHSTIAELKSMEQLKIADNELLSLFLKPQAFENEIERVDEASLFAVSSIDESQRRAIAKALGQKITVITGPPGTGKTQLIVNLIANALGRGMSTLIASKNNRAVDNVKDRLDAIDTFHYTLRYGKREILRATQAEIQRLQNSAEMAPVKLSRQDAQLLRNYRNACSDISEYSKKLARKEELLKLLPEISKTIEQSQSELSVAEKELADARQTILETKPLFKHLSLKDKDLFDKYRQEILSYRNKMSAKYSGLSGFFNNLFAKTSDAQHFIEKVESMPAAVRNVILTDNWHAELESYRNGRDIVSQSDVLLEKFKTVEQYFYELSQLDADKCETIKAEIHRLIEKKEQLQNELAAIEAQEPSLKEKYDAAVTAIKSYNKELLRLLICERLSSKGAKVAIAQYQQYLPDVPTNKEDVKQFARHTSEMLKVLQINATTSLSVKSAFPLSSRLFDLLIIDEASQCDLPSALPMILRAKRVVIIGDPLQLKHISAVRPYEEEAISNHLNLSFGKSGVYGHKSLWDHAAQVLGFATSGNSLVNLENHYRCHPDIIGFANKAFYLPRTGINMAIKTEPSNSELRTQGIILRPVIGIQKAEDCNSNEAEAQKCIEIAKSIRSHYPKLSLGIVTPFRHQAELINKLMPEKMRADVVADTVNRYQGDERDIIIYSLMVTDNSPKRKLAWIDNKEEPNLINVAITRARNLLCVVGNIEYIKRNSPEGNPLGDLLRYVSEKQKV